jgi:hypothetical protein
MKRILLLTVIAVFVMMPLASFARTSISDSELGSVIAQEGVTIDFGQFSLGNISINTVSWGDGNGFGATYAGAGWVGASVSIVGNASGPVQISGTMNIDVGTNGARTAVGISLPTITINGNITSVVKLDNDRALSSANVGTLGTAYISGLTLSPSGSLIIYAH